jgi:putative flippase GtrA
MRFDRGFLGKLVRCAGVSAATTALSLSILVALVQFGGVRPAYANVAATFAGIGPSFALNRRWVWKRAGRGHLVREVLPFWAFSLTGLALSTLAVDSVAHVAMTAGALRTLLVVAANVATFGTLWIAQFVLLDRVLFAAGSQPRPMRVETSEPMLTS